VSIDILRGMWIHLFINIINFFFKGISESLSLFFPEGLILERFLFSIYFSYLTKMNNFNTKRAVLLASAVLAAGAGGIWFYTW